MLEPLLVRCKHSFLNRVLHQPLVPPNPQFPPLPNILWPKMPFIVRLLGLMILHSRFLRQHAIASKLWGCLSKLPSGILLSTLLATGPPPRPAALPGSLQYAPFLVPTHPGPQWRVNIFDLASTHLQPGARGTAAWRAELWGSCALRA